MKCPRCQSPIASSPDPTGALVCPACGARLRSKAANGPAARGRSVQASTSGTDSARAGKPAAAVMENPSATLPPGTPLRPIPKAGTTPLETLVDPAPRPTPASADPSSAPTISLDVLLEEIRGLRRTQEEILELLRERPGRGSGGPDSEDPFGFNADTPTSVPIAASLRTRKRKSVLIMDDDAAARQAVVTAFERAEVPVRAVADGNAGLQALAEERCDVLILELGMGGAMAGKDVVNVIKATMEWVDIPIVLHTRVPMQGQKEARQIHGADELIPKAKGSEEALVSRVIQLFRRP